MRGLCVICHSLERRVIRVQKQLEALLQARVGLDDTSSGRKSNEPTTGEGLAGEACELLALLLHWHAACS